MNIPYGFADGVDHEWCIHDHARPDYMLCGRRKGFMPVTPPPFPRFVHDRCRAKWFRTGQVVPELALAEYGMCPECEGDVPLKGGLVEPHGQWVVGKHGPSVSGVACDGAGRRPVAES